MQPHSMTVFKYNVVMGMGLHEGFKYNVVMGMGLHEGYSNTMWSWVWGCMMVFKYNVVMGMGLHGIQIQCSYGYWVA